jgi:hypothetical protein
MAASGAGNAELNSLLRSRAAAGTTGTPAVPQSAPRMSAREQLAQPSTDLQILRMQATTGIGSMTQKAAAGRLAQIQAQTDATARQQAEAAKLAGDRDYGLKLKTAGVEAAAKGAMERQTAAATAAKERLQMTLDAARDELTRTGKDVNSPEYKKVWDDTLAQKRAEAKATGDTAMEREVFKAQVSVLYGQKKADGTYEHIPTPEEISALVDGKPQSTASIVGEVNEAKTAAAGAATPGTVTIEQLQAEDINKDGKVDAEEMEFNAASKMIERDDARIKAGQPAKMSAIDRARAEELIKKVRTDIRNKLTGKPQSA